MDEVNVHACVAAIVRRETAVLLCHRSPERQWYPNVWDLPGGHVEPGEAAPEALARELREELGMEINVPSSTPFVTVDDHALELHLEVWVIDEWFGTPTNLALEEHDAVGWFQLDELLTLPLADERYRAVLREAMEA
jgi:mutator protein MutT